MSFRRALETSNNLVTLKIGLDIGLDEINKFGSEGGGESTGSAYT